MTSLFHITVLLPIFLPQVMQVNFEIEYFIGAPAGTRTRIPEGMALNHVRLPIAPRALHYLTTPDTDRPTTNRGREIVPKQVTGHHLFSSGQSSQYPRYPAKHHNTFSRYRPVGATGQT